MAAGVLATAYVVLAASVLREEFDQRSLATQIDSAGEVLTTSDEVRRNLEDLPGQIEAVRAELLRAHEAFPAEVDGNRLLARVLDLTSTSGVLLSGANASEPETKEAAVGPESGALLRFELQIEGAPSRLLAFLVAFEQDEASASTRVETFALQAGEERSTLLLELVVFGRTGSTDPESPAAAPGLPAGGGSQ